MTGGSGGPHLPRTSPGSRANPHPRLAIKVPPVHKGRPVNTLRRKETTVNLDRNPAPAAATSVRL